MRFANRCLEREAGFTLLETAAATSILVVGLISLAALIVYVAGAREQSTAKDLVLNRAQSLMEEIRATSPELIASTYDGKTYSVLGVDGANPDGSALAVTVDTTTNPRLLLVRIAGTWNVGSGTEQTSLVTRVFAGSD